MTRRVLPRPGSRGGLLLEVDLGRGLADVAPADPVAAFRHRQTPRLSDVVGGLRRAALDRSVAGVVVLVGPGPASVAQAQELGLAIRLAAVAGRPTFAFAESFGELGAGNAAYLLAAHCDEIWMQPTGALGLTGVALEALFLRGALDRLGVEPQIGRRHEYKSAAETLLLDRMSAPNREMTQRVADSATESLQEAVATRRGLSREAVAAALAAAPLAAEEAVARGLVDRLGYRDELYDAARERLGAGETLRLRFAHRHARRRRRPASPVALLREARRPAGPGAKSGRARLRRPTVALVSVHGPIVLGRGRGPGPLGPGACGADVVVGALRAARDDERVRAVVLRVESPGGSAVASDAIRRAVVAVRESGRPVVVSMGRVAASGGYFVSMAADAIVALPSTITGSIGVLGGKVVTRAALERLGIARTVVASGPRAAMFSSAVPFDDEQWAHVERWLDAVYEDFTRKAAHDRGMPVETLEPLARGRVWTGIDARERRLVDALGGLDDAISLACARAGIDRERARVVPVPRVGLAQRLRPAESTESAAVSVPALGTIGPPEALAGILALRDLGVLSLPWDPRLT